MTDREFLIWLHERLEHQYHVNRNTDWMHKLRVITVCLPREQQSVIEEPKDTIKLLKDENSNK